MRAVKGDKDTTITWVQCGLNPVDRVVANGTTVYVSFTLPLLRNNLWTRETSVPFNVATPSVVKNLSNLKGLFTDGNDNPLLYYKGESFPNWKFESVSVCDKVNKGNGSTKYAVLNVPNCNTFQLAFYANWNLRLIFILSNDVLLLTFNNAFWNCGNLELFYSDKIIKLQDCSDMFNSCYKLTLYSTMDFSSITNYSKINNFVLFNKLDLLSILNLADAHIGLPAISSSLSGTLLLGISKAKLAKDTTSEIRVKYPLLFNTYGFLEGQVLVGKTKYENNNIVYLTNDGLETTSIWSAVLNEYITDNITGKFDIATVLDVTKITDWNKYYGFVNSNLYATGLLLYALTTLKNKGWNIAVQYN